MLERIKSWQKAHPDLWEFIMFNVLSNCATVTNFVVMWICTGFLFAHLASQPFQFLFFDYTNVQKDLGLCGFLSFLLATTAAQTVNFFVQKNFVFKSNAAFSKAAPRFVILAIALIIISSALPAYSQALLINLGVPVITAPTIANFINVAVQVLLTYPLMKFWIMPKEAK